MTTDELPPLDPAHVHDRAFYHYRHRGRTLVGVVKMSDALAAYQIECGRDLWPCEWGLRVPAYAREKSC